MSKVQLLAIEDNIQIQYKQRQYSDTIQTKTIFRYNTNKDNIQIQYKHRQYSGIATADNIHVRTTNS